MSDSNPITPAGRQPDPSADLATRAWETAPDPSQPTLIFHDISTPGTHAPGRVTLAETTENIACSPRQAPQLPPIPGYEVERFIGRGGMGVVYRATHTATGRVVALKLTNPGGAGDDTTRRRFVREVHALAAIKHPNIVPMYDAHEWLGFAYCTMEFVPGGNLNQHLDRFRADLPAAVRLVIKVARAVEALHVRGILHRDLKPLNILLGENDEPMVADFGLAKWMDDDGDLTHTGLPVGTRQYMSPEQTLGLKQNYTAACDVWAMGVTLYELLTGHRPFTDDGMTDVYHCIRNREPSPMAAFSPDVPAPLQAIVSKCLAKQPGDRYPTAGALADALERWLRGDPYLEPPPTPAPPVGRPESVKKSCLPHVLLMGVGAAIAVVAVVLFLRKPAEADEPTPPLPEPQKPVLSIAQRLEAGEAVKFTDGKGRPLVPVADEPDHQLLRGTLGTFHTFSCNGTGIASASDEPLAVPYRVEAVVGVRYASAERAYAGIYVGRRTWPGLAVKHESLVSFTVGGAPVKGKPERRLVGMAELFRWEGHGSGSPDTLLALNRTWDIEEMPEGLRFAQVVLDVRPETITATIDGEPVNPVIHGKRLTSIPVTYVAERLAASSRQRAGFPSDYAYTPPMLGSGIGIFCQNSTCVVRDLTVSKLKR